MAVPKRKSSKRVIRTRKSSHSRPTVTTTDCPECGAAQIPHRVCSACGYYNGKQVLTVDAD